MTDVVLVVNCGSSSLKFSIYRATMPAGVAILSGKIAGIGRQPTLSIKDDQGAIEPLGSLTAIPENANHEWLITALLSYLQSNFPHLKPIAAGHRVVHGGQKFTAPVLINDDILKQLRALTPLAPLHQPLNLTAINAIARNMPKLRQVACFDTSFHRTMPRLAQLYAIPRALSDKGIIRYGFHGLSYEYIAGALPDHLGDMADGRIIVAHLGNGASMCALQNRKSIATTMGFTALDGLMMGRRCGALDPGIVLHLQEQEGMSSRDVHKLLYQQSGLLGVSGSSNNMRILQESDDPAAKEAIELFCYQAAKELASLVSCLGGLDALVFTAGIGENAPLIRRLICERSSWLGIALDDDANKQNAPLVNAYSSHVKVLVIPTDEQAVIVRSTLNLI